MVLLMLTCVTNYLTKNKRNFRFEEKFKTNLRFSFRYFSFILFILLILKFLLYYAIFIGKQATLINISDCLPVSTV